jgi:hypothetical protein
MSIKEQLIKMGHYPNNNVQSNDIFLRSKRIVNLENALKCIASYETLGKSKLKEDSNTIVLEMIRTAKQGLKQY